MIHFTTRVVVDVVVAGNSAPPRLLVHPSGSAIGVIIVDICLTPLFLTWWLQWQGF
jgi:hypothetical protein